MSSLKKVLQQIGMHEYFGEHFQYKNRFKFSKSRSKTCSFVHIIGIPMIGIIENDQGNE